MDRIPMVSIESESVDSTASNTYVYKRFAMIDCAHVNQKGCICSRVESIAAAAVETKRFATIECVPWKTQNGRCAVSPRYLQLYNVLPMTLLPCIPRAMTPGSNMYWE